MMHPSVRWSAVLGLTLIAFTVEKIRHAHPPMGGSKKQASSDRWRILKKMPPSGGNFWRVIFYFNA
jgi:hypothetical protein